MAIESSSQLIGILIGGFAGYIIAAAIAGGGYRYIGGSLFEITREPMSYLPGCLFEIVMVAIGAGVGYFIGSMW